VQGCMGAGPTGVDDVTTLREALGGSARVGWGRVNQALSCASPLAAKCERVRALSVTYSKGTCVALGDESARSRGVPCRRLRRGVRRRLRGSNDHRDFQQRQCSRWCRGR
jgi:hypothetical protein